MCFAHGGGLIKAAADIHTRINSTTTDTAKQAA
ncbi:hypothetical protein B0G73_12310 [Paraburkholderia sp. BL25I1N1]|nr:hypothetical protein B0G73_12310 [Paraburkholderia sp. BL25I1N1]